MKNWAVEDETGTGVEGNKKYLKHRAIEKDACEGLIDEKLYNEGSNIRNN